MTAAFLAFSHAALVAAYHSGLGGAMRTTNARRAVSPVSDLSILGAQDAVNGGVLLPRTPFEGACPPLIFGEMNLQVTCGMPLLLAPPHSLNRSALVITACRITTSTSGARGRPGVPDADLPPPGRHGVARCHRGPAAGGRVRPVAVRGEAVPDDTHAQLPDPGEDAAEGRALGQDKPQGMLVLGHAHLPGRGQPERRRRQRGRRAHGALRRAALHARAGPHGHL